MTMPTNVKLRAELATCAAENALLRERVKRAEAELDAHRTQTACHVLAKVWFDIAIKALGQETAVRLLRDSEIARISPIVVEPFVADAAKGETPGKGTKEER
ncbi:MAG: hypothetical protein KKF88_06880 [Alphaproteobacteria bacterium]|nr:hypothetical protein [Alphaproteobacteria bacterium]